MHYITTVERIGIAKGEQIGIQKERLDMVLRLLIWRYFEVSIETETRIRQLPPDQLEYLARALLDFQGREDLYTWLDAHQPVTSTPSDP